MSSENVEILRRVFQEWAGGDLSGTDIFDADAEYSRIGAETPDMEGRWRGLDEMRTAMRDYLQAMSDLRIEAERIIDLGGNRVLVLSRHTARGKQSGVPIEREGGELFTLRDGKIVRYDAYWSRAAALEAVGLSESPMLQENVEVVRRGVEAWNQHDADLWLSYAAPEIEWMPAGPATVETTVYRGYEEVATGFAAVWETWEEFRFQESEVRALGDSVLWLGRVEMKGGASHVELDQEFAIHAVLRNGKVTVARTYLAWEEALEAAELSE